MEETKIQKIEEEVEKDLHISQYIIAYKFLLGLFETLIGLGIIIFGRQMVQIYQDFKTEELFENPHGLIVSMTEKFIPYLFDHRGYVVFILMLLGITKLVGAVGLYYKKMWGLDILVFVTILLLPFDLEYFFGHPTITRFIFLIINMFIALYLLNFRPMEYFVKLKKRMGTK